MQVYLDHQASTPVGPRVLEAMLPHFYAAANPHADEHAMGWAAADAVEEARAKVAASVRADPDEIVFTAGATEANNMAILGVAALAPEGRRRIVVSAVEHKSVLAPARALTARGFEVVVVGVDRFGTVDLDEMARAVAEDTLLVSVMAVNNEVGGVQPIAGIAALAQGAGALFHCDAAQALLWMPIDVFRLGVDLLSVSAHKAGGPKGIGALYVRRDVRERIGPVFFGGGQEGGLRPGTLPTPLCVGFGEACAGRPDQRAVEKWRSTTRRLAEGMRGLAPALEVNGPPEARHPGNLNVRFPGVDADALIARMQPDVAVSRASACSSGVPEPSHVLRAMGLQTEACDESIRFSTGPATTSGDVEWALDVLRRALAERPSYAALEPLGRAFLTGGSTAASSHA